jgi:hypothetical protein
VSICGLQFFKPSPHSVGSRITSQGHLFRRGEVVVHRDLFGGRIWYARAEIVVEDTVNGPLLTYWGPGAEVRAPVDAVHGRPLRLPIADWVLEPRPWHSTHVLSRWCVGGRLQHLVVLGNRELALCGLVHQHAVALRPHGDRVRHCRQHPRRVGRARWRGLVEG